MLKVGLCQMPVVDNLAENHKTASEMIAKAAGEGAKIVCLPEMFCCPYENSKFVEYAQPCGELTWQMLSNAARENEIWLIGGSVPELCERKIYNTSYVFSPQGEEICKHRKVHLFDIDIPNGQRFMESDTISPGDSFTVFDTEFGKIGLAICFDIRFAEQFRIMAQRGAEMVFVPAAFNMTTGPAHWELSFRMRAVDNQYWMLGCAPARDENGSYVSYANSIVTDPWGEVRARLGAKPDVLIAEIDTDLSAKVRNRIPIMKNRRTDLY